MTEASGGENEAQDLESAHALIKKLREEIKDAKADRTPQDEKDARTIASLKRQIDDLKPLADKAKEIEQAGKSEADQLREELAAAKSAAQEATTRADRLEVAVTKALPEDDAKRVVNGAKRIVGASREELEADADDYFASFKPQEGDGEGTPPPSGKPREQLRGGGDPTQEPQVDAKTLVDSIPPTA